MKLPRIVKFVAAGGPGLALAFGLNYLLSGRMALPAVWVYPFVLTLQMLVNYTVARHWVFGPESAGKPFWRHFGAWALGTLVVRGCDWAVYTALVSAGLHYLLAQACNVLVFNLIRYQYNKRVFGVDPPRLRQPDR